MQFTQAIAPADFPAKQVKLAAQAPSGRRATDYSKITSGSVAYSDSPHIGLMWTRYQLAHVCLDGQCSDWAALALPGDSADDRKKASNTWSGYESLHCFLRSVSRLQPQPNLKQLRKRRDATHASLGPIEILEATTTWRSAVGLGNASTFENSGITLHATYGFPILPASSLKGVARHFLVEDPELLSLDQTVRDNAIRAGLPQGEKLAELLFGKRDASTPDDSPTASDDDHLAGIRMYDGWPTQKPGKGWFDIDVLTVHHKDYYGSDQGFAVDTESPVPVHFLTLRPDIAFSIPIGLTSYGKRLASASGQVWLRVAKGILQSALQHCGVGAKTASGYGRMSSESR